MATLSNRTFTLQTDPSRGTFSFLPSDDRFPRIENARVLVHYRIFNRKTQTSLHEWAEDGEFRPGQIAGIGPVHLLTVHTAPDANALACSLEFAVADESPMLFWRLRLENGGEIAVTVDRLELLRTGGQQREGQLRFEAGSTPNLGFYANGWQSWSLTGTFGSRQVMPQTWLGPFQSPMVDPPGTPAVRQAGYFGSDMFGSVVDRDRRTGLLAGFLSQREQFGSVEAILFDRPSLRLWANGDQALLEAGESMQTDWAVLLPFEVDRPDAIAPYLDAVARHHNVRIDKPVPTGWCSWYYYYTNVTAENIRANLDRVVALDSRLPLDLVQIDDGFEPQPGDWFDFRPTFPEGVAPLAAEIKAAGKTPGLWLAPFIVHPKSDLAKTHPDWLLRTPKGRRARAGFVWNSFPYGLDLTVPDALDYARRVIHTAAHKWGFPYLKLDFLYAAALECRYQDPTRTRAQVLRAGMEAVREAAGDDVFLLGCGLPLGSALGLVDAMRISPDVGESWRPRYFNIEFLFKNEWRMPSARNAIQNSLTRAPLHRRWWINDPDCLLVRPDSRLTLDEVQTLAAVIGLTGGSLLLSDDLPNLAEERLHIAESLLPVIDQPAWIIDMFDETTPRKIRVDFSGPAGDWHVVSWFNPDESPQLFRFQPQDFHLPGGSYALHSFWDRRFALTNTGENKMVWTIPPHGSVVLAVRPYAAGQAQYMGSDLHISQGMELCSWEPNAGGVSFGLRLPRQAAGSVDLCLPGDPLSVVSEGRQLDWEKIGNHCYRIPVNFEREIEIKIRYAD